MDRHLLFGEKMATVLAVIGVMLFCIPSSLIDIRCVRGSVIGGDRSVGLSIGGTDQNQRDESADSRPKRAVTRLRYKDCGQDTRAIKFDQLSVKPIPIQIPGFLDLRILANVTRKLPSTMDVKLVLKKKYFDTQWMRIPCIEHYGSCRFKSLSTCILTQDVFGCPIRTGYHDIDQKFMIPDPQDSLFSLMLEGEYKAIIRARHPNSRKELACLVAHFSLKNRSAVSSNANN